MGINLPNLANNKDTHILDEILNDNKDFYVVSNNLYGLSYISSHKVIAGIGMNVFNNFSISYLQKLGVSAFVVSIEQQKENINDIESHFVYALGYVPLMTFAHCPYKTINENSCKNCSFKEGLNFFDVKNNPYKIYRYKMSQCYFKLLHSHLVNNIGYTNYKQYINLNGLTENEIKLAFEAIEKNKKISLSPRDIFGKLNHQVK